MDFARIHFYFLLKGLQMLAFIKRFIKALIPDPLLHRCYYPYRWQLHNARVLAKEYNQLESMQKWQCINKHGEPLAWITYPCLDYLEGLDFSGKKIMEWGGVTRLYIGGEKQSLL